MISDVLSDAAAQIRNYLRDYKTCYVEVAPLIEDLLKKMDTVRILLDTPPSAQLAKEPAPIGARSGLSPELAHAVNRLMDPPPKYDPLRRYVAVYRIKGKLSLSFIAFTNQIEAWTKPTGPNVPRDLDIVDVIDVKHPPE